MITPEHIRLTLEKYLGFFPEEKDRFDVLAEQIELGEDITSRKNFHGHVTASGLVISSNNNVLAIFHNKLQKYLQPGGHLEREDESLIDSAKREVAEETGLREVATHPWCQENLVPIFIDTHVIPENKNKSENEHYHHDFMFVFCVKGENILLDRNEVSDFKWVSVEAVMKEDSNIAKALRKMKEMNIL